MTEAEIYLKGIDEDYSEWKEMLGDNFPLFVNKVLAHRLLHTQLEKEYLKIRVDDLERKWEKLYFDKLKV